MINYFKIFQMIPRSSRSFNGSNKSRALILFLVLFFPLVIFSGCSSAPKKPAAIYVDRNMATNLLNLANSTINRGFFEDALLILDDARRLAVSADDPSLRLKTAISRGNCLFSLGRHNEAFRLWETASAEGEENGEYVLASLARISLIRARLIVLSYENSGQNAAAEEAMIQLNREMNIVKSDSLATAAGHVAMGIAEKQLGRWTEAENTVKKALDIHDKGRFLEDAAYDWYLIASIRSVAQNYKSSIEALHTALSYDRRAENGFGLGSSWQAMGDVYQKAGSMGEARSAWRRSAEIFRAIGHTDKADNLESLAAR